MIIVGLGNPGEKYSKTRHNAGFIFLDRLNKYIGGNGGEISEWRIASTFNSNISQGKYNDRDIVLIKPLQYMNRSGDTLFKYLKKKGNIDISKGLIVVYDDLDIKLGEYKITRGKIPKAHNGVNNIVERIGSSTFISVRLGVDDRDVRDLPHEDYVLMRLGKESLDTLNNVIDSAIVDLQSQFLN